MSGQVKPLFRAEPDELQAQPQLEQEMGGADDGAAPADVDQVLDHHRLVPRGRPQDRRPQSWHPLEGVDHLPRRDLGDDDVAHRREAVVRGAQEHAAQAHEVARDREIDHLPAAVRQQLVRARPALLQDERVVTLLALVDDLGVRGDRAPPRLEPGKARQLILVQRKEPVQLLDQSARNRCHRLIVPRPRACEPQTFE